MTQDPPLDAAGNAEPWRDVVFRRPWWLDAVAPGSWAEVFEDGPGGIVGHLPFQVRRLPLGLRGLVSPPLTPGLGAWVAPGVRNPHGVLAGLINRLPRFDYFAQNFDRSFTDWLPLHWAGFSQTTRYTYVIDDVADPDRVWAAMDGKTRNTIRKAEGVVKVREAESVDELIPLLDLTFGHRRERNPMRADLVRRVFTAARAHNSGRAVVAVDDQERAHAGALFVWDERSVYNLINGSDPTLRSGGAVSLLLWDAIKHANSVSASFDFEGSMLPGVEPFFRQFGGRQVQYSAIRKAGRRMTLALAARDFARALLGRQ